MPLIPESSDINPEVCRVILDEYFDYFKRLSPGAKWIFIKRLIRFMNNKAFYGMNGQEITDEVKVLISASATQLTFGLKEYIIPHFDTILVYPETFLGPRKLNYKGYTQPDQGRIALSWKDFLQGYADLNDKYNLGLHEMAHALKLNVFFGNEFDQRFADKLQEWQEVGNQSFVELSRRTEDKSFLREYGGSNTHEFFAVCVEHFFEAPEEFKKELPEVYTHLLILLNQDPLNIENDYTFNKGTVIKIIREFQRRPRPRTKPLNKDSDWHWSLTIMLAGIFLAVPLSLIFVHLTVVTHDLAIWIWFLIAVAGIVVQYKPVYKQLNMMVSIYLFYAFVAFSPMIMAVVFGMNYFIPFSSHIETHEVVSYFKNYRLQEVHFKLKDGEYDNIPHLNSFEMGSIPTVNLDSIKAVEYFMVTGIFGFDVCKEKRVVLENDFYPR